MGILANFGQRLASTGRFLTANPLTAYAVSVIKRPAFWQLVAAGVAAYFILQIILWLLQVLVLIAAVAGVLWILSHLSGGSGKGRR